MNCAEIQRTLEESLGCETLPDQIESHLQDCPTCRQHWEELCSLTKGLGSDKMFEPTAIELERMVSFVGDNLEERSARRSFVFTGRLSSMAAAAVLILTASAVSYQWGRYNNSLEGTTPVYSYEVIVDSEAAEEIALEDETVSTIIDDYITETGALGGDQLLDDLTDEEYDYLVETMKIGDIL